VVKTREQNLSDLAHRIELLQAKREEINQEISTLLKSDIAEESCWIVRYRAKGKGGAYWYYKWQSGTPIFVTKNGSKSCHKYIGKAGSPAFLKAVEMMKNRTKIEALNQVLHTLELGLNDLVEEATRYQKSDES
jgi:BMFP domain-containing protein YqiC